MKIRNLVVGIGCVCLGAGALLAANNKYISMDKAEEIALKKIPGGKILSAELDYEYGRAIYDIDVVLNNYEYDLKLDAKTGTGISMRKELRDDYRVTETTKPNAGTVQTISVEKAKEIALKKVPGATITKIELDTENGRMIYDIDLVLNAYEYDLKIDAKTGAGISMKKELRDGYSVANTGTTTSNTSSQKITAAKAKEIALQRVPGSRVVSVERDDNAYEVELRKGYLEYQVKVDIMTGNVLKVEVED